MLLGDSLDRFRRVVVKEAKTALTKQSRNFTKDLYNSIKSTSKVSKNSFELAFYMADHGKFQDQGVKGFKSTYALSRNSPFKFGKSKGKKASSNGLSANIFKWVKFRRFQFRDRETGKFMSYKQTAGLVSSSIYNKGIKATRFFSKPFDAAYKNLPEQVIKAYSLDVDNLLKNSLQ
jgi:hypothetical protein